MPMRQGSILREELVHLRALQLARQGRAVFALKRVNLKIVLGQIDSNSDKLFHGRSPYWWRSGDHALAL